MNSSDWRCGWGVTAVNDLWRRICLPTNRAAWERLLPQRWRKKSPATRAGLQGVSFQTKRDLLDEGHTHKALEHRQEQPLN